RLDRALERQNHSAVLVAGRPRVIGGAQVAVGGAVLVEPKVAFGVFAVLQIAGSALAGLFVDALHTPIAEHALEPFADAANQHVLLLLEVGLELPQRAFRIALMGQKREVLSPEPARVLGAVPANALDERMVRGSARTKIGRHHPTRGLGG